MATKNKNVIKHRQVNPETEGLKRALDGVGHNLDVLRDEIIKMQQNVKTPNL